MTVKEKIFFNFEFINYIIIIYRSVQLAYNSIRVGDANIVVAGGQESMTQAPHFICMRNGTKMGDAQLVDTLLYDGLTDKFEKIHMGVTAENLVTKYNITREDQDALALESQRRAKVAQENGYFTEEIVSVEATQGRNKVAVSVDEYPKPNTDLTSLQKLRPCFVKTGGTVTAGNASGINDSAAAVLLMSQSEVARRNAKPLAKIVAFAQAGVEPKIMGIGVVPAVQDVLLKAGWSINDVDLFELNEAFAAQSLSVARLLGVDANKVNIHGGAIALGHPIGASGTRVIVTLLYALKRTGGKKGIASLCIGGGMGIAVAIEMV